jgi:anti-sigma28 factor (negative regulator of flagellin synthesis)
MAFSQQEKKEIENVVRKEIKDFFKTSGVKQYEKSIVDMIKKEIQKGTLKGDINDIVIKIMTEFYYQLWSRKNQWQSALKNVK